jgi:hypothetical protein
MLWLEYHLLALPAFSFQLSASSFAALPWPFVSQAKERDNARAALTQRLVADHNGPSPRINLLLSPSHASVRTQAQPAALLVCDLGIIDSGTEAALKQVEVEAARKGLWVGFSR